MTLSMLFDMIVCVGLLAGFLYTLWFNKKLTAVQNSRQQFQNLLDTFAHALERGQNSLAQLQEVNARIVHDLDQKMSGASLLVDDLSFFIDRGEGVMNQLENHVRSARTASQDFEHLIQAHEDKMTFPKNEEQKEQKKLKQSDETEQPLERLKQEKLFKTEVRLDHPWGTTQRKRNPLHEGGRYS